MQAREFPSFGKIFKKLPLRRGAAFGAIILVALFAFEIFNYSTTEFALGDLLGDLSFAGVRWSTILAIAFCGIDFAGIARLFTPEESSYEQRETWYLFGAWLLAATMNAMLTWWGVSLALLGHETLGSAVVERQTLMRGVPIFIAVLVWLIRVLIIGTFAAAGERLFTQPGNRPAYRPQSAAARSGYQPAQLHPISASSARRTPTSAGPTIASRPTAVVRGYQAAPPPPPTPVQEPEYVDAEPSYSSFEATTGRVPAMAVQPSRRNPNHPAGNGSGLIRSRSL